MQVLIITGSKNDNLVEWVKNRFTDSTSVLTIPYLDRIDEFFSTGLTFDKCIVLPPEQTIRGYRPDYLVREFLDFHGIIKDAGLGSSELVLIVSNDTDGTTLAEYTSTLGGVTVIKLDRLSATDMSILITQPASTLESRYTSYNLASLKRLEVERARAAQKEREEQQREELREQRIRQYSEEDRFYESGGTLVAGVKGLEDDTPIQTRPQTRHIDMESELWGAASDGFTESGSGGFEDLDKTSEPTENDGFGGFDTLIEDEEDSEPVVPKEEPKKEEAKTEKKSILGLFGRKGKAEEKRPSQAQAKTGLVGINIKKSDGGVVTQQPSVEGNYQQQEKPAKRSMFGGRQAVDKVQKKTTPTQVQETPTYGHEEEDFDGFNDSTDTMFGYSSIEPVEEVGLDEGYSAPTKTSTSGYGQQDTTYTGYEQEPIDIEPMGYEAPRQGGNTTGTQHRTPLSQTNDSSTELESMFESEAMEDDNSSLFDEKHEVMERGKGKGMKDTALKTEKMSTKQRFLKKSKAGEALESKLNLYRNRGAMLVFTGSPGTGKTVVSANIANLLCKMGYSVVMLDLDTIGKGQAYINAEVCDMIHSSDNVRSNNVSALNSGGSDFSRYLDVVRPGFHMLSSSLGSDSKCADELISNRTFNRLIRELVSNYNFVIVDVGFQDLKHKYSEFIDSADSLVFVEEATTHGMTNFMLNLTNIEDETLQSIIFHRGTLILNREDGMASFLGRKVDNTSHLLDAIDEVVSQICGGETEFKFRDMAVAGVIPYNNSFEPFWYNKKYISDTESGERLFKALLTNCI